MYANSCFLAVGSKSESTKLEICSVGTPLPETMDLPTGVGLCILVSVLNSGTFKAFCEQKYFLVSKVFVGHFFNELLIMCPKFVFVLIFIGVAFSGFSKPPIVAYRKDKSLKYILVRAKIPSRI